MTKFNINNDTQPHEVVDLIDRKLKYFGLKIFVIEEKDGQITYEIIKVENENKSLYR